MLQAVLRVEHLAGHNIALGELMVRSHTGLSFFGHKLEAAKQHVLLLRVPPCPPTINCEADEAEEHEEENPVESTWAAQLV